VSAVEQAMPVADGAGANVTAAAAAANVSDQSPADLGAEETYSCATCSSSWSYRVVRNTGRCPSCGGGLVAQESSCGAA
jgi:hypothetical protein